MTEERITEESMDALDKDFWLKFNYYAENVYQNAKEKGFWEGIDLTCLHTLGNKIMLMVGELAEAHETIRKRGKGAVCEKPIDIAAIEEEFADAIIRIMDTAHAYGFDVGKAIVLKAKYNSSRPYMHGKKF